MVVADWLWGRDYPIAKASEIMGMVMRKPRQFFWCLVIMITTRIGNT